MVKIGGTTTYTIDDIYSPKKIELNWIYATYKRFGNVLLSQEKYNLLDKRKLGKHKTRLIKAETQEENTCVIVEKI